MQCPDGGENHLRKRARLLDSEAIRRIESLDDEMNSLHKSRSEAEAEAQGFEIRVTDGLTTAARQLGVLAEEMGQ